MYYSISLNISRSMSKEIYIVVKRQLRVLNIDGWMEDYLKMMDTWAQISPFPLPFRYKLCQALVPAPSSALYRTFKKPKQLFLVKTSSKVFLCLTDWGSVYRRDCEPALISVSSNYMETRENRKWLFSFIYQTENVSENV